jgi:hypothetical protein
MVFKLLVYPNSTDKIKDIKMVSPNWVQGRDRALPCLYRLSYDRGCINENYPQ